MGEVCVCGVAWGWTPGVDVTEGFELEEGGGRGGEGVGVSLCLILGLVVSVPR